MAIDVAELFARDPLSLTTEDIDRIIEEMRQARARFLIGDKKAGKVPEPKAKKAPVNIDLKDLDLDL